MRKINVTIEIEDDDFREHELHTALTGLLGHHMVDYRVFVNADHLKDDATYKKLVKAKVKAGKELDKYILNKKL